MSKIGKKLSLAVFACIAIVTAVCISITITLASNHSDTQMQNQSDTGVKILQLQVTTELEKLQEVHELLDVYYTQDPKADFDALWKEKFGSDSVEFGAIYDKSGSVIWSSDNYKLADFSPSSIGDGYSGVVADSAAGITFQYAAKFNNGETVAVLGMDVSRADALLEEVKEETLAEVTIFQGVTRYATTVLNADGTKAVGTDMAANVAATVIEGGEVYTGQADILGQNHFVHYEPMLDINGNIVGAYFAGFSSAENDALFTSMAVTAIIIACLIAIGSIVVMLFLIKRMIEKPILEANTIVHSMSEGYLGIPDSDYNFADDEIGNFVLKLEQTKHTLNSYIRDMSKVLSSMAHGDFSQTTKVVYIGDFIDIENSFLLINKTLKGIIDRMNISAIDVFSGSSQIADGSQILADGTTKQASAVQELSATLSDIAEQVKDSAQTAAQASELASLSAQKINVQNGELTNLLMAMEEIKSSSAQIEKIIKEIDDIAFQTNILALNAAVEAARAGSAGKGFAVVADEVRNLASKCAESAKNTGALISASIVAVGNGAAIAQNTADTMQEVIELSNKTDTLIHRISKATETQAHSLEEINSGVQQISTVIQQNSATAEQTAASCEELNSQSKILRDQVGKLKA